MKRKPLLQHLQFENWILKTKLIELHRLYEDIQSEYKGFRQANEFRDTSSTTKRPQRRAKRHNDNGTIYYVHEYNSPNTTLIQPTDISSCYSSLTHSD